VTDASRTTTVLDLTGMLKHAGYVLESKHSAALAEIDLTPRMYCVLAHALDAERSQAELAELAYLDKTTMVVTIDGLEAAGLVERRPSPADRRARIITVTKAGARVAAAGRRIVDRVHAEVLAELPRADRARFVDCLTTLVEGYLAVPAETARPLRRQRQRVG